jgi:hypothetical protein
MDYKFYEFCRSGKRYECIILNNLFRVCVSLKIIINNNSTVIIFILMKSYLLRIGKIEYFNEGLSNLYKII